MAIVRSAMSRHLYNSKLSKFVWFANRFGAAEMIRKPLRLLFAPVIIPFLAKKSLPFQSAELDYFYHRYNMTWACERCLEVPVGRFYLEQFRERRILEVGNVLSHYFPVRHDVLDKFERGKGIINLDIVDFAPDKPYDLVLSISTFEHIGFDDEASTTSDQKIRAALFACRNILAAEGKLVITVPIGYNPHLDRLIREQTLGASREVYFVRTAFSTWTPADRPNALKKQYRRPFPYANALLVAEFTASP
ncbi:MAG: hypothetical protein HYY23_15085 [Verrucomicrobia bacterium]|nr:hypothetical protein [Verrucomicrobiota bacterium]